MPELKYTSEGYPYYDNMDQGSELAGQPVMIPVDHDPFESAAAKVRRTVSRDRPTDVPTSEFIQPGGPLDELLGLHGKERYQLWPEKMVRSGLSLARNVATGETPINDPVTGHTSDEVIQRVLDMEGMAGAGLVPGMKPGGVLGTMGGKLTQPGAKAPPLYSAVEHAIENSSQGAAPAEQWLGYLKNQPGVKQEELDWLGLGDLQGKITKEQLLEHARGHGAQVETKIKSGEPIDEESIGHEADQILNGWGENTSTKIEPRDDGMFNVTDNHGNIVGVVNSPREAGPVQREFLKAVREGDQDVLFDWSNEAAQNNLRHYAGGAPKFAEYQLPGGDNYREMLLTLPQRENKRIAEIKARVKEITELPARETDPKTPRGKELLAEFDRLQAEVNQHIKNNPGENIPFRSSHWDEPNVLAHVRMNDRQIPGVGNTLHLEEVQSDWHQQGRKKGYVKPGEKPDMAKFEAEEKRFRELARMPYSERVNTGVQAEYERLVDREHDIQERGPEAAEGAVPDAPFKQTWPDLALKRAIRIAAEEGKDAISWTPGAQQAARYDLSKKINQLHYDIIEKQLDGFDVNGGHVISQHVPEAKLPDVIGKEMSDRLLKAPVSHSTLKTLEGTDLKIGGEGMIKFYDKMLVDKMNAIAKKYGGKVEYADIMPKYEIHEVAPPPKFTVVKHGNGFALKGPDGLIKSDGAGVGNPFKKGQVVVHYEESIARQIAKENNSTGTTYMVDHADATEPAFTATSRAEAEQWIKDNSVKAPFVRLTPAMKDAAMGKGFPMFMRGFPLPVERVDHDPWQDDRISPNRT